MASPAEYRQRTSSLIGGVAEIPMRPNSELLPHSAKGGTASTVTIRMDEKSPLQTCKHGLC